MRPFSLAKRLRNFDLKEGNNIERINTNRYYLGGERNIACFKFLNNEYLKNLNSLHVLKKRIFFSIWHMKELCGKMRTA